MENIIITYRIRIITILGFLLINCNYNLYIYAQSNYRNKTMIQYYNIGIPSDTAFFQELEPILEQEKMSDYKIYEIVMIHQKKSKEISFEIRGIKTPFNNDLYMVKYHNKTYLVDGEFVNILFKKGGVLMLEHTAYLAYEDFDSPILTLQYIDDKIQYINKRILFQGEYVGK